MSFTNEEEMLQAVVELVEQASGLVLSTQYARELLVEIQREQLKGLIYKAFIAVNQPKEVNPSTETGAEENGAG